MDSVDFPVLMANANVDMEPELKDQLQKSTTLYQNNRKIGLIGINTVDTAELSSPGENVIFTDAVAAVQSEVDFLTEAGVNIIILLSHSSYGIDKMIAANTTGVDVIVGGHDNTYLSNVSDRAKGPYPTVVNGLNVFGFGPTFGSHGGRQTVLPPIQGERYQVLVPTTDRDGHDIAGVRTVDIAVPVGSSTGWNLYPNGPRGKDLCALTGSFFPFAKTRADRIATGDSRLSLEERYRDHAGFVDAVRRAAADSVAQRLLLQEDAKVLISMAEESDVLR